ncbi:hypothetical protein THFILI_08485 [Thermus filiformis]|uniref:Ig-like domain-containing protein n=1 Tax=Thermus filiformis TaxID=276 RepID=A0A0A2WU07_THEFI|nr:hypothetical protein THFILI_08485 [Thermus filiformis]
MGLLLLAGCGPQGTNLAGSGAVSLSVGISKPAQGAYVNSGEVEVRASASRGTVESVQVSYAGPQTGTINLSPAGGVWRGSLPAGLPSGEYTLTAKAKVGSVEKQSDPVRFTLDRTLPTVGWTRPADGVAVSGTVRLEVGATDNVGVAKVEFYTGSTKLGEATSAPYALNWNTAGYPDGQVTLKARAVDAAGNVGEATLSVTVDNTPPVVEWLSPRDKQRVGGVVTLVVAAQDGVSGQLTPTLRANGQPITDADQAQAGVQWDTRGYSGEVELEAEATDGAGNRTVSRITVTVDQTVADQTPPAVQVDSPASGSVVRGRVTVQVRATDNVGVVKVEAFDGALLLGSATAGVNGVFTLDVDSTKVEDGSRQWRVLAWDAAGNVGEATLSVTVDNTPPVVEWLSPRDKQRVGGVVTLVVAAQDGVSGQLTPTLRANGQPITDADQAQAGVQWDTRGYSGEVELEAEATDGAGNRTVSRITVTVDQTVADQTPPAVQVDSPASGSVVRGRVTVQVRATDNVGVVKVEAFDGALLLGSATAGVNGVFTLDVDSTKVEDGSRQWRVLAWDAAGNVGEATLSVTVDNTPPVVEWLSPRDGQVLSLTSPSPFSLAVRVRDANPDPASIQYEVDGNLLAGSVWDLTPVQDGDHFLTVRVRDLAGNEASSTIRVEVDRQPPQVSWNSPSDGAPLRNTVTLQIKTEDWPGVERVFVLLTRGTETQLLGEASGDGRFWTLTLDTTSFTNGNVSLEAVAVNRNGLQSVGGRSFVIDNPDLEKPVVSWIDPLNGQNVAGIQQLRVQALDNQAVQEVRLFVGGQLLRTFTQPPYILNDWDTTLLPDGPVVLKAVAVDTSGNQSDPAEIQVNVRNGGFPPALSILRPEEGGKVGVQFLVQASVTKQGTAFTWSQPLKAKVYDYRGNLVKEAPMLVNGASPPDNSDSVAEAFLDLGNVPSDLYRLVVEGEVLLGATPFRLYQERLISVVVSSNLPPALVVYQPLQGSVLTGRTLYLTGEVTDDSGEVRAVEVRLIGGGCATPGFDNYLMRYEAGPYGVFFMAVPLDGHPYIADGDYCLRVVAVDKEDLTLRNIQEFDVRVDRGVSDPVGTVSVITSSDPVVPGSSATWTVNFGASATYTVLLRKDGVVQEVYRGTGSSVSFTRSFSDRDLGSWDVVAVYVVGGVQGALSGGSVAVVQPTGP